MHPSSAFQDFRDDIYLNHLNNPIIIINLLDYSDIVLGAFYALIQLILTGALYAKCPTYYSHFTDKETNTEQLTNLLKVKKLEINLCPMRFLKVGRYDYLVFTNRKTNRDKRSLS